MKRDCKSWLLGLVCLQLLAFPAAGSAASPLLTLDQALHIGLQNNLQLQSVRESLVQSQAGIELEQGRFDPELQLGLTSSESSTPTAVIGSSQETAELQQTAANIDISKRFTSGLNATLAVTTNRESGNDPIAGLDPGYRTTLSLNLQQPLLRDFGRQINTIPLQQADLINQQSAFDLVHQQQLLANAIETAYINLAQAQQIEAYQQQALKLAEELVAGNRKKLDFGQVPISEVQQAETAAEARRSELLLAEQAVATSREALLNLLDVPLPEGFRVQQLTRPDTPMISLAEAVQTALAKRPDLRLFALAQQRRNLAVALGENQLLPRLDLLAGAELQGLSGERNNPGSGSFQGNWFDSGTTALEGDHPGWLVGLSFSYPLGNRSAKSALLQVQSRQRQSRLTLQRQSNQVASEVRTAWLVLHSSLQRAEAAQRNAELATKTLEQENQRIAAGLSDSFRLLIIQDNLIAANIRLGQAVGDARRGLANLEQAMGITLNKLQPTEG